jgi:Domain of unknown function (DUF222)
MFDVVQVNEHRSGLEQLRSEVLSELPDALLEEDFAELHRLVELLELERLRRLAEIERRGLFARDGHLSLVAWLADRFRVAWGNARSSVRRARVLQQMPETRHALERGEVSLSAAHVLIEARETNPQAFELAEEPLVEAARRHSLGDLRRVASIWRERVEREGDLTRQDADFLARRNFHASVTFEGMVRTDGDLDPEAGEALLTALGAYLDAEARSRTEPDPRTPSQRRADALGEISRQWLDRLDRPTVAGERPHLTVTVPVEVLAGGTDGAMSGVGANGKAVGLGGKNLSANGGTITPAFDQVAEFDHVGPIGTAVLRRLACDASVMRIVMAGASQPLDVGRRTPVVLVSIRRAVIARDRRCRFPGCERPHAWCDCHHVWHWADGGPTALSNLVLLCRPHHRKVHESGGFSLQMPDGVPVFHRPDGTVLEDRSPP